MKINEQRLRNLIRVILEERIVNFLDTEYYVSDDIIAQVKQLLKTGGDYSDEAFGYMADPTGFSPEDQTYTFDTNGKSAISKAFGWETNKSGDIKNPEDAQKFEQLKKVVGVYGPMGEQAANILLNDENPQNFPLFSHTGDQPPDHPAAQALLNLEDSKRGQAAGKGEILVTLLYGPSDSLAKGDEVDVRTLNKGDWHVKDIRNSPKGNVSWGQAKEGREQFDKEIRAQAEALGIDAENLLKAASGKPKSLGVETAMEQLETSGLPTDPESLQKYEIAFDAGMRKMAASGGAQGVLFITPEGFQWTPANEVKFYGNEVNTGRVRIAMPGTDSGVGFASLHKGYAEKQQAKLNAARERISSIWDKIKENPLDVRYNKLSMPILKDFLLVRGIMPADLGIEGIATWGKLKSSHKPAIIDNLKNTENLQESLDNLRNLIREALLLEELTKTDKAEIKRIAKKQAKSVLDSELDKALGTSFFGNKGKVNKFVEDEISKRFKAGDKDKDFSDAVEKVAKRVLQALYTMHYKRNNLIKTMPVPKG